MPIPPQGVNACFGGFSTAVSGAFRPVRRLTVRLAPAYDALRSEGNQMSKLSDANARLDAAMTRLDAAVQSQRARAAESTDAGAENEELRNQLTQLQSDFDTLRDTSGTVSSRLDAAIGRLRTMLDE